MPKLQRYISDELTHFVGSGLSKEKQFDLLLEILRTGWLTYPPHEQSLASTRLTFHKESRLSSNHMYEPSVVCFCDIPIEDFHLHMAKYSQFGLAFKKTFLAQKGANPVFYVALASTLPEYHGDVRRKVFYSAFAGVDLADDDATAAAANKVHGTLTHRYVLFNELGTWIRSKWTDSIRQLIPDKDASTGAVPQIPKKQVKRIQDEIQRVARVEAYIFAFFKFFDHTKSDDDRENFYMEREWRIFGNLQFDLGDVERVIIPRDYSVRLRDQLPSYSGQVTFVD